MADYIPEEDLDQVSWFVSICGKIAPISSILMFLSVSSTDLVVLCFVVCSALTDFTVL